MNETEFSKSTGMTPRRLESLADGIFAFAMTLLVLAILISFIFPGWSSLAYLSIPVLAFTFNKTKS